MSQLRTYDDWKHCITEICGIPLTPGFVTARLEELRDTGDYNTQKFVDSWGEGHRKRVVAWFEQAEAELSQDVPNTNTA